MNEEHYTRLEKQLKQQADLLKQIIASIESLQKAQHNGFRKFKNMPDFVPGVTFETLKETIDFKMTACDLLRFKEKGGYVKMMLVFLSGWLKKMDENVVPLKIIDRQRKIFYIKSEHCWCTEIQYNNKQFDILLDHVSHFIYKSCFDVHTTYPTHFDLLSMNDVQYIILESKGDVALNKRIRYKFINTF